MRQTEAERDQSRPYILAGNKLLIEAGGLPLEWPTDNIAHMLGSIVEEGLVIREKQEVQALPPKQLSLLAPMD